jgi:hypothetical protein
MLDGGRWMVMVGCCDVWTKREEQGWAMEDGGRIETRNAPVSRGLPSLSVDRRDPHPGTFRRVSFLGRASYIHCFYVLFFKRLCGSRNHLIKNNEFLLYSMLSTLLWRLTLEA